MNFIFIGIALVVGFAIGYIANTFLTSNKHDEELALAFERGKDFERMSKTKVIDDLGK